MWWIPNLNAAVEYVVRTERDQGIAHYRSVNRLWTSYVEKVDSRAKFGKEWAALEELVATIGATIAMYSAEK